MNVMITMRICDWVTKALLEEWAVVVVLKDIVVGQRFSLANIPGGASFSSTGVVGIVNNIRVARMIH